MEITLRIPDDFAHLIGTPSNIERRALEALALDEFRQGHLSRAELRQLFGFATRGKLDEFLTAHGIFGTYTPEDLERDRGDLARLRCELGGGSVSGGARSRSFREFTRAGVMRCGRAGRGKGCAARA